MPLTCPRCSVAMDVRHAETDEGAFALDVCPRCRGLWLDREELFHVCRVVSDLPHRSVEVALVGEKGRCLPRCPRCAVIAPVAYVVWPDFEVDVCLTCGGVWLHAADYDEGLFDQRTVPANRGPSKERNPYRAVAPAIGRGRGVACVDCARPLFLAEGYFCADGLVCRACFAGRSQRERAARPNGPHAAMVNRLFVTVVSAVMRIWNALWPAKQADPSAAPQGAQSDEAQ